MKYIRFFFSKKKTDFNRVVKVTHSILMTMFAKKKCELNKYNI